MEQWAELRREHFVRGVSIKELMRRTGLARNTIRTALRSEAPPGFRCPERPSKLDPFKEEIHELLRGDPALPGVRVRELIESLGFDGGKSIVDDYLREVRLLFRRTRTHQRTVYQPGEICQWDQWETSKPVPVGHGQARRAWVVVCCLGYSRAGAGALIFSKEAPDVLWGMGRCLWSIGGLPRLMVWDREGCLHAGRGRPTDAYAGFYGQLRLDWYFCQPADPQAKGAVERLQGYMESNFEPGRHFANPLDFQLQLDAWFEKANARTDKTLRAGPIDRLAEELQVVRAYAHLPPRHRQLCWAHLKRDFTAHAEGLAVAKEFGQAGLELCERVFWAREVFAHTGERRELQRTVRQLQRSYKPIIRSFGRDKLLPRRSPATCHRELPPPPTTTTTNLTEHY